MTAFAPLFIPFLIGFLILRFFTQGHPLKHLSLLSAAAAGPLGFGLISLALFSGYAIHAPNGTVLLFAVLIPLISWLLQKTFFSFSSSLSMPTVFFSWPKSRLLTFIRICCILVFIWSLAVYLKAFLSMTCLAPNGDWDARFFWNVKAKFYLRDPEAWRAMFSSVIAWSHPDYPLLIPGTVAWGWNWAGQELLLWPALTALVFSLSILGLIVWHLAVTRSWETGLIAASFLLSIEFFRYWSASQYADIPEAFFFLASAVFLVHALKNKTAGLFFLSGLMAGFSAWTKNEGLFFVLWVFLTLALYRGKSWLTDASSRKELFSFLLGLLPSIMALLLLKTLYAPHGDYLGSKRTLADYTHLVFQSPENTRLIFTALKSYTLQTSQWLHLWHLGIAAIAVNAVKSFEYKRWDESWIPVLLAALILAGYILVIHVTPHPVAWQIETALTRLLLHAAPLVLIFFFEVLGPEKLAPSEKIKA